AAGAAGAGGVDAGLAGQQVDQVGGLAALDIVPGQDGDRGGNVAHGPLDAAGGDLDGVQGPGLLGGADGRQGQGDGRGQGGGSVDRVHRCFLLGSLTRGSTHARGQGGHGRCRK